MTSSSIFVKNREKILNILPAGAVVILKSNILYPRNGDQYFPFRQDSNFYYITGLNYTDLICILYKSKDQKISAAYLFISQADLKKVVWEGEGLNREKATTLSGITNIDIYDAWQNFLQENIDGSVKIYVDFEEGNKAMFAYKQNFFKKLKKQFPFNEFHNISQVIEALRVVKEPEEISLIKKAVEITSNAFYGALEKIKPQTSEKEIESTITTSFLKQGATGHSFSPIIASGFNACTLHYNVNNGMLQNGDMLLMDFGCEYQNYAADCTRTVPVSGKFSKRQQEIYQCLLEIFYKSRDIIKPGISITDINKKVLDWSKKAHVKLGLYSHKEIKNEPLLVKRFYPHGACHYLGLDVHDVGNRDVPLQKGMVLTCEPGIYIPNEKIGVRLENDILVTDNGNEDLMKNIPVEIVDIENLMHKNK